MHASFYATLRTHLERATLGNISVALNGKPLKLFVLAGLPPRHAPPLRKLRNSVNKHYVVSLSCLTPRMPQLVHMTLQRLPIARTLRLSLVLGLITSSSSTSLFCFRAGARGCTIPNTILNPRRPL